MKKIVSGVERKPRNAETVAEAWIRRDAERRTIATNYHAALAKRDALRPLPPDGAPSLGEVAGNTGDALRLVMQWAEVKYANRLVPNRKAILADWREQYGRTSDVTEHTMQKVRERFATKEQKNGGRPTHRKD